MTTDTPSLTTLLDSQLAYTISGEAAKDGSVAIARGRTAGLAIQCGLPATAKQFWAQVPALSDMPDFDTMHARYAANPEAFATFGDAGHFSAPGTAFSNAMGSYAYALDYLSRGEQALAGGEAQWICHWGAAALRAAGFPEKADIVGNAWQQKTPPAHIATAESTTTGTAVAATQATVTK